VKVIDVSCFQGQIDWSKVKTDCEGAILRVGYRGYGSGTIVTDIRFMDNARGAILNGIPVGVYFVTQAINTTEAVEEAVYTLKMIKGFKISLPVFIDSENGNGGRARADHGKLSRAARTRILKAFCTEIKKAGYKAGIYASESWYKNDLEIEELNDFYLWVAKYSNTAPSIKYDAWQHTDRGTIRGITGYVDMSQFKEGSANKTLQELKAGDGSIKVNGVTIAGNADFIDDNLVEATPLTQLEYHTIKGGETLTSIAKKYGTTVDKLVEFNQIKNPNMIYAGEKIRVH
jgi:GH25 family lysozyme M1 (1,4-beta-N-acetylmuramidase)